MAERIGYIPNEPILPISGKTPVTSRTTQNTGKSSASIPFGDVFQKSLADAQGITFSGHAQDRMKSRNIQLSASQLDRMSSAIERAAQKGSRDSLLLVDNVAAVVNVENRTVVTVVDGQSLRNNVFTNIDSAVIA